MSLNVKVGNNVYKVSKIKAESWSYFAPLLKEEPRSKIHELPLSYKEFMAWSTLNIVDGLVPYSSAMRAVELLMPVNAQWATRVYLDDAVPQDQRMEHYERVGNYVRSMGKKMPYMGKSYGIHANFSLHLDPIYKSRYCSELNALQIQSLLTIKNLTLLTGIVHDAWLRCRHERITLGHQEELPWNMIRWQDVAQVQYPNILNYVAMTSPRHTGESPGVADKYRAELVRQLVKKQCSVQSLTWTQSLVAKELNLLDDSVRVPPAQEVATMRIYSYIENEETLVTTGFETSDSMLPHLYLIILRGHVLERSNYSNDMQAIGGHLTDSYRLAHRSGESRFPPEMLSHVTSNILYRGRSLTRYKDSEGVELIKDTVMPVRVEDFGAVIEYGASNVGIEAMELLASSLRSQPSLNEREQLFCRLVDDYRRESSSP